MQAKSFRAFLLVLKKPFHSHYFIGLSGKRAVFAAASRRERKESKMIQVQNLSKTFYVARREAGLKQAFSTFFRRE